MNRYPVWKYVVLALSLVFGLLYTLPNFFGEAPAVQVSSAKATQKIDDSMVGRVGDILSKAGIESTGLFFDGNSVKARFASTDLQLRAKDAISRALNADPDDPSWIVALNLLSDTPRWLTALHALPMYLGLDLRGGVHFLLQVDMKEALAKRMDGLAGDIRTQLRDRNIRHAGIDRVGDAIEIRFRDADTRERARAQIADSSPELALTETGEGGEPKLVARFREDAAARVQQNAVQQNITTLSNRINELGVSEPVIQQQGPDRVVVQLPGVQDTAKAKDILGRTATLEVRMVCESPDELAALAAGTVPFGCERFAERGGRPILLRKQVILTGANLNDAQAGFDGQTHEPAVHLTLDAKGARIFRDVTRENIGRRMAIVLVERGKGEVVTAPVIRSEIAGGRVQISGSMTTQEANDVALLLRAGSLAAPMEIIEERTIGPSLGADNIRQGFHSTLWGFVTIAVFMVAYYHFFGLVSAIALSVNLLLLVALLSLLQATLTLPGIAAIALTLGMAIDANVLINERVREELRNGATPQAAISAGYDNAWATILDSNITSMIAGVALLIFGSGPVRGFAVVHVLGLLTSMFSAVFFSRGLVNFWYGRRRKLAKVSIGQVWKPSTAARPSARQG
ncbi:MAG: protein translocase subunit SecD [Burkholderiaceae bacterium]|nr:protein translocase subunit SecD [Burkholderiaceae bacterium]